MLRSGACNVTDGDGTCPSVTFLQYYQRKLSLANRHITKHFPHQQAVLRAWPQHLAVFHASCLFSLASSTISSCRVNTCDWDTMLPVECSMRLFVFSPGCRKWQLRGPHHSGFAAILSFETSKQNPVMFFCLIVWSETLSKWLQHLDKNLWSGSWSRRWELRAKSLPVNMVSEVFTCMHIHTVRHYTKKNFK